MIISLSLNLLDSKPYLLGEKNIVTSTPRDQVIDSYSIN